LTAKTIGEFIRQHRVARGLTQTALAERLGVVQGAVSNWENEYNDIRREDFVRVAEALEIPEPEWPEAMRLPVRHVEPTATEAA